MDFPEGVPLTLHSDGTLHLPPGTSGVVVAEWGTGMTVAPYARSDNYMMVAILLAEMFKSLKLAGVDPWDADWLAYPGVESAQVLIDGRRALP